MLNATFASSITIVNFTIGFYGNQLTRATHLIPPWVLSAYLIPVCAVALLLNIAVACSLLRHKTNGATSVILQLAISDILILATVASIEGWSRNIGTWNFGQEMCIVYLGFEVFSSNANVYFLAVFALHSLASANLHEKNKKTRIDSSEDRGGDGEIQTSLHSLVARDDSPSPARTLSIDYRRQRRHIPVILPIMFVWFLAASLCVPEFASATTVYLKSGPVLCTFVDTHSRASVRVMLSIFDLFVPVVILAVASVLTLEKLRRSAKGKTRNRKDSQISRGDLHLSLFLCGCYFALILPRSALNAAHVLVTGDDVTSAEAFLRPPLYSAAAPPPLGLAASLAYFSSCLIRPCLYTYFLPELRDTFSVFLKPCIRSNREINV